jgi:hypothetical protein
LKQEEDLVRLAYRPRVNEVGCVSEQPVEAIPKTFNREKSRVRFEKAGSDPARDEIEQSQERGLEFLRAEITRPRNEGNRLGSHARSMEVSVEIGANILVGCSSERM